MKSLRPLFTQRAAIFRDRPTAEFTAPASWQLCAARDANFAEAGILWRCARHAAVAAIRPTSKTLNRVAGSRLNA